MGKLVRLLNWTRAVVPRPLRRAAQRIVPLSRQKLEAINAENPLSQVTRGRMSEVPGGTAEPGSRVGIIRNQMAFHTRFVKACQECGCDFRVIDLAAEEWLLQVRESGVDFFLVWPDAVSTDRAKVVKDRCDMIEDILGIPVYPKRCERWIYEDKVRLADWLASQNIAHPRTWVFCDRTEAMEFVKSCSLPIVFKLPFGAGATGVQIIRSSAKLRRVVKKAFGGGHAAEGHDLHDRQRGSVILQEFLPDVSEWRMVRIGDGFMCRKKRREGDFHSGSGGATWEIPAAALLDFAEQVSTDAGFRAMAMDIFEPEPGRYLVNELQTVFGDIAEKDRERGKELRGRWVRSSCGEWAFEEGDFYRESASVERLRDILETRVASGGA
jgi:glutathione synthase/RimK-type ligase-like ATP-grasp enzyme